MNKKFLSVVLFGALMAGSSVTFTGCIDNDEPAGIENLRGAKAELLRAKVAVEAAEAAYKNAQATEMLAQARQTEALALQAELTAKEMELNNALLEAQNAELIANAEAAVVKAQKDLEDNKLALEKAKLENAAALAQAQKDFEDAMKAIELSKNYLSDAELEVLADVQGKLNAIKEQIYGATNVYKEYVAEGEDFTHTDDKGNYNLVAVHTLGSKDKMDNAYEAYETAAINPENYIDKATLENNLTNAQASLDIYTAKLNLKLEALAILKNGDAYQAWLKLQKDYHAKADSLNTVIAAKKSQANKIIAEQTPTIDALVKAIGVARDIKPSSATGTDSVYTVSTAIEENLEEQASKFTGFVKYEDGKVTANFGTNDEVLALAEAKGTDDKTGAANYATLLNNSFAFADGNGSAYKTAVGNINNAIAAVNNAKTLINANEMAYAKEVQTAAKKAMDDQKKVADAAIKVWNDAVTSYNSGTSYTKQEYDEAYGAIQILLQAVKDGTTGYTTDAQIKSVYDKYTSFRAVMTANGQKELPEMPKAITSSATLKTYLVSNEVKTLLPTEYTAVDLKATLLEAAMTAFGTAGIYNDGKEDRGVLVKPTDGAIKGIEDFGTECGAQGLYLAYVDDYNTATENVEKVAQFDKVIAQLNSWKASLAAAKVAYMTKNKATIDAVTAAQKAVTDKVATPIAALGMDKDNALLGEINAVLEFSVDGNYASNNNAIIAYVKTKIAEYEEEIGHKKGSVNPEDGTYYSETTGLYLSIETAEKEIFEAKKMLELYNAGDLKAQYLVDTKKEAYEAAKEAYERDLEEFNYWNGKLKELMGTLYGKSTAE